MKKSVPNYIKKECEKLSKHLAKANESKYAIEKWAQKQGIDTDSNEWWNDVVDDCLGCSGEIDYLALCRLLENIMEED